MQMLKHQTARYTSMQWGMAAVAVVLLGGFYALGIRPAVSSRANTLANATTQQPDMDQFMREITQVSEDAALKKMTVQVGAPKRDDRLSEMPIGLNFTGDFNHVLTFLRQTEEMQRLTRIRSLTIKTRDARQGAVDVDVALNIYFADE
jgi:Tfp pilus assembly protein PilO